MGVLEWGPGLCLVLGNRPADYGLWQWLWVVGGVPDVLLHVGWVDVPVLHILAAEGDRVGLGDHGAGAEFLPPAIAVDAHVGGLHILDGIHVGVRKHMQFGLHPG